MKYFDAIKNELLDMDIEGENYKDSSGKKLYFWQHPITKLYRGISENDADKVRYEALDELRKQVIKIQGRNRLEVLRGVAEILFKIYSHSKLDTWLSLPSDTRHGKNTSRLSDHLIVTSAITSALVLQSLSEGKHLLRLQD